MIVQIPIDTDSVGRFCRRHHIRMLSLFGSVLREDFTAASDVDMLVEFEPGYVPGLITLAGMEMELAEIIGRKVDLRTAEDVSRHFRQQVLEDARLLYVSG